MVQVRRGVVEDHPEVLQLLSKVWHDDYVPHLWLEWVERPEAGIVLVAEEDARIVGTCYVDFMPHGACWFQALRVHPGYRRLGVGRALTNAGITESRLLGRDYAYLGIDAENTASLTMTAKAGFTQIAEYSLMARQLPVQAFDSADTPQAARWRKAVATDLDKMLTCAAGLGRTEFIACWQWQPLSGETLSENIERNNLWVQDDPAAFVFAGFEDSESHPHLFDPCGDPKSIKDLIASLTADLRREEETKFEVWLHHDNPMVEYLIHDLGFAQEEGYTIWQYPLQPAQ